jgi:endonuclease G
MAKLRTNHDKKRAAESSGMIAKVGLFSIILGALYFFFNKTPNTENTPSEPVMADVENLEENGLDSIFYLPTLNRGQLIRHKYYALSYNENYEQAEWIAFELTADRLKMPWVNRTNDFRPDPLVETGSADPNDYRRTKYDRGHLVAAADMAFSEEAMSETFFMSNMSPQVPGFNKGIWRELEELTRDWAKKFKHLYVVTGPIIYDQVRFWIGENQVAVPDAYYRILLDLREPEKKAIAFIIPNEVSNERLEHFATSIDKVEDITGIDFFPELMSNPMEESLEADYDVKLWQTNEKKYEIRVKEWNIQ